jgi:hypothetical protein
LKISGLVSCGFLRRLTPQNYDLRTVRSLTIAVLGSFLCGAGLCIPAIIAGKTGLGDLFLAAPADMHAPEIDVQKIEGFCDAYFPLSYEIPGPGKAVVLGIEYPVALIGTNSHYPRILAYSMAEGSFFSKQAWKDRERHAVLNGKAAFDLFGSSRAVGSPLKIRGEIRIVRGVINDGDDENRRIYLPSSAFPAQGGKAVFLLARGDAAGGADASYIRDSLKSLGVYAGAFDFFDLGAEIRFFWERSAAALMLLSCLFPAFLLPPALGEFRTAFSRLRRELKRRYLSELLCSGGGTLLKFLFSVLALPACAGAILFLLLRILSVCLPWQDLPSLGSLDRRALYPGIAVLLNCGTASAILFCLFLVSLALVFVFYVSGLRPFQKAKHKKNLDPMGIPFIKEK